MNCTHRLSRLRERVDADGNVIIPLDVDQARTQFQKLHAQGIESLAIVLLHACAHPQHELALYDLARDVGFESISLSHQTSSLRKIVPRGDTTVIDAYLNPILQQYIRSIQKSLIRAVSFS